LGTLGAPVCFLINAASFAAVLLSLFLMKLPAYAPAHSGRTLLGEFSEGLLYVWRTPKIGRVVLMVALASLLVAPYTTVLPVFTKEIFKGGPTTYGYISGFFGAGVVIGTLFLATRKPEANLGRILLLATILMGIGLISFAWMRNISFALCFAVLIGLGGIIQFTICNIMVQSQAAPPMRGRAIGILLMAIFGMLPLGSLLVGWVSQFLGAPSTMMTEGIIGILLAVIFSRYLLSKPMHPDETAG
jgi:MFS family permease